MVKQGMSGRPVLLIIPFFLLLGVLNLPVPADSGYLEGVWVSPEEFRFRGEGQTGEGRLGAGLVLEEGKISGWNGYLDFPRITGGSLVLRGLAAEMLSPSLVRSSADLFSGGTGFRADTSSAGGGRRGAVFRISRNGTEFALLRRGESGVSLGGWWALSGERWFLKGGILYSLLAEVPDPDTWILARPLPGGTELIHAGLTGGMKGEKFSWGLLTGGTGGPGSVPDGWGRVFFLWKDRILEGELRAGICGDHCWKPDGIPLEDRFSWKAETRWFPLSLFGGTIILAENQRHPSPYPEPYLEFDSFCRGEVSFRPGRWIFSAGVSRKLRGEASGSLDEERTAGGEAVYEGRNFRICGEYLHVRDTGEGWLHRASLTGRASGRRLSGKVFLQTEVSDPGWTARFTGELRLELPRGSLWAGAGLNREAGDARPLPPGELFRLRLPGPEDPAGVWDFRLGFRLRTETP